MVAGIKRKISIEIETAIRKQSWATVQVGQKSLQTLVVDFDAQTVTESHITGSTKIFGKSFGSIRDDFKLLAYSFTSTGTVSFSVKGQTASAVGFMPNIDYKFDILLTSSPKLISVTGYHDGYPSYNVSINGKSVYDYIQGHLGQLLGESDVKVNILKKPVEWN